MTLGPANPPSGAKHGKAQQLTSSNRPIGIHCGLPAGQQPAPLQTIRPPLALLRWKRNNLHSGSSQADSFNTLSDKPTTLLALPFRNGEDAASLTRDFCVEGACSERFG